MTGTISGVPIMGAVIWSGADRIWLFLIVYRNSKGIQHLTVTRIYDWIIVKEKHKLYFPLIKNVLLYKSENKPISVKISKFVSLFIVNEMTKGTNSGSG